MVGAGRERAAGIENLLEELAVGTVRPVEDPADRYSLTKRSGVHPDRSPTPISATGVSISRESCRAKAEAVWSMKPNFMACKRRAMT